MKRKKSPAIAKKLGNRSLSLWHQIIHRVKPVAGQWKMGEE